MKRTLTIFIAAAIIISSAAAMTGCSIKRTSPEDTYSSPLRSNDTVETPLDAEVVEENYSTESVDASKTESEKEEKKEESKAASKAEDKKESKAESKAASKAETKAESKAASKAETKAESKTASKAETKAESKAASKAESKTESKAETKAESKTASKAESKAESKAASKESKSESKASDDKNKDSAIYKDMVSLLNDSEAVGYTICKIAGSDDEHLVIAYGSNAKKKTSSMDPTISTDIEEYQRELAAKDAAANDEIELARSYSIYRITDKLAVPEGDIEGFYTTAYISSNTSTLGIYYARNKDWRFGLVEINDGSAAVNYTNEGELEDGSTFPSVPGAEVSFNDPKDLDPLKKYK